MDANIRIVGRVGDVDPLNDGGVILDHGGGRPQLVYLVAVEDGDSEPFWERYTVDLLDIDDDLNGPHAWASVEDVARSCGYETADLVARSKSEDLLERASAVIDVAGYYGWLNFDSYPGRFTEAEAEEWSDMLDEHERAQAEGSMAK